MFALLATVAAGTFLDGCASKRRLRPKLAFASLTADKDSPQTVGSEVRWTAEVSGGVGDPRYEFRLRIDGEETVAGIGTSPTWDWTPRAPGTYSISVVVRDSLDYTVRSGWIDFEIAPPLVLKGLKSNLDPPQRAKAVDVYWAVETEGGVGDRTFEFLLDDGTRQTQEQTGTSAFWKWSPRAPGDFRLKVVVRDSLGNIVESGWSERYRINPAITRRSTIAVLPFENLSGHAIPLEEIRAALLEALEATGLHILSDEALKGFMARHRMRYTGGLSSSLGQAIESETGVDAVLVGSVEQYLDVEPPRLALVSRLVTTGQRGTILWTDDYAHAGHQSVTVFEVGRVFDVEVLLGRAVTHIGGAVQDYIEWEERRAWTRSPAPPRRDTKRKPKFGPDGFYRFPDVMISESDIVRVAVLPFENESSRADAGDIMSLHFMRELSALPNVDVAEPGNVRQALLQTRLILGEGPSLPETDLLRVILDVDLVVSGSVTHYEEPTGEYGQPKVSFFVQGIESEQRHVGWASTSHSRGNQGMFFFDVGRIHTAYRLATLMVREVVAQAMGEQ